MKVEADPVVQFVLRIYETCTNNVFSDQKHLGFHSKMQFII